jgi:hypothetical protein
LSSLTITAANQRVTLDGSGAAHVPFTVTNTSMQALRGRLLTEPQEPARPEWLSVIGEAVRNFAPSAAVQVIVQLRVPSAARRGRTRSGSTRYRRQHPTRTSRKVHPSPSTCRRPSGRDASLGGVVAVDEGAAGIFPRVVVVQPFSTSSPYRSWTSHRLDYRRGALGRPGVSSHGSAATGPRSRCRPPRSATRNGWRLPQSRSAARPSTRRPTGATRRERCRAGSSLP